MSPLRRARSYRRFSRGPWLEHLEDRTLLTGSGLNYPNPLQINPPPGLNSVSNNVAGDFANNGRMDFASVQSGSNTLLVYPGNGDGTFQPPVSYQLDSSGPADNKTIAVGDFSGNGILDLAIISSGHVYILMGKGDGTFGTVVNYLVPTDGNAIAVGDFTGNGKLDIVVDFSLENAVEMLLGNGDGTFQAPIQSSATVEPSSFAVGDFNGDGKLDLGVEGGTGEDNQIGILPGNGNGTFGTPIVVSSTLAEGLGSGGIATTDLNGDGKQDLITVDDLGPFINRERPGNLRVWMGNGDGTFQPPVTYAVASSPDSVVVADLTGSGAPDLVVGSSDASGVTVLLNNGDGTLAPAATYDANGYINSVLAADFNGDGKPDILADSGYSVLLTNKGDGTFDAGLRVASDSKAAPFQIATGDLTGSGLDDIVTTQLLDNTISVVLNNGHGGFDAPVSYSTGAGSAPMGLALADLTGNGIDDIVVADSGTNNISIFFGNGDGTFQSPVTYACAGTAPQVVAVGDLTGDGKLDIVTLDIVSGDISVFLNNGNGAFGTATAFFDGLTNDRFINPDSNVDNILLGDFSGDGKLDAVVSDPNNGVSLLPGNGDGTFGTPLQVLAAGRNVVPNGIAAGDFTGNGRLDLAVSNFIGSVDILLNEGGYTFQSGSTISVPPIVPGLTTQTAGLAVDDLTGDGHPDVIVGTNYYQIGILVGNGDGTFEAPVMYDAGPGPSYPVVADFEANGDQDIAVADTSHNSTAVTVLKSGTPVSAAPTVTEANDLTVPFRHVTQSVTLSATVTSFGLGVNKGTVTFSIYQGGTRVGTSATSVPVSNGVADAVYTVPAGLPLGTYTIQAVYSRGPDYQASSDATHTLTVAPSSTATTTVAKDASIPFSETSQTATLNATVTSGAVGVSEGTVTFSVFQGNTQIGVPVTSGTVSNGAARAVYTLPAGQPAGTYTIRAVYIPGPDYVTSSDDSHALSVGSDPTTTTVSGTSESFRTSSQTVTLTASVTAPTTTVNEGTVTFTVLSGGVMIGVPVTATVPGGPASASYTLPAGLAPGSYSILARYSDASGDFQPSDNSATLGVLVVEPATTTTVVDSAEVGFSTMSQAVTFHARITSLGGVVGGGTVTFTVLDAGDNPIGTPVSSPAVFAGAASATFIVPPGTPAGRYTIQAVFNGTAGFQASQPATSTLILDGGPIFAPIDATNSISLSFNQFPQSIPLNATSPTGSPLTYSATVTGDNPLYDLQQKYLFSGVGYFTAGTGAYVLHSNQPGPGAGGYYLIRPSDGALLPYDGSGSYAHSFAGGSPLATLGALVYNDPALLLSAQPPADYSSLYNLQQLYQFTKAGTGYYNVGGLAFVLQSSSTNIFGNRYYLLQPGTGDLFAYDGSGSYSHSFARTAPLATLGASVFAYPSELINAEALPSVYPQLNQLNQQYDLQELNGSFYTGTGGNGAQWIYSPSPNQYGRHWYTLTLSSDSSQSILRAWAGYADPAIGATIATLPASVYANPAMLTTAVDPPEPPVIASVNNSGMLQIALTNSAYVGAFKIGVSVSDGLLSSAQTVTVTSTDTGPTLTVQQGTTTVSPGSTESVTNQSFPLTYSVNASGANNAAVTTTASVSSFSTPFALQQLYQFKGVGYFTAGTTAYVLQANGNNSFGNPYYLLTPTGQLYAYDGSGSYSHSVATGPALATLGGNVYQDPTLLFNAQPPINYSALYSLQRQYDFQGVGFFTAGASAYVLVSPIHNSFGNPYYLLNLDGALYAYDGSGDYGTSFATETPLATLDPAIYVHPSLLINAIAAPTIYGRLFQVEQQFDLQELPSGFSAGLRGNAAKWLYSPIANQYGQHFYTLVPAANNTQALLYAWDGGSNSIPAGTRPVATLDGSVYFNPQLLLTAVAPEAATGVTATLTNGTLQVNAPTSFVGTVQVTLVATDGAKTTTRTFQIAATDTPPVPTPIVAQTASLSGSPLQLTLGSTDADNDTVTYSASAAGFSATYNLQQVYQFKGVGYYTVGGVTAYVLSSSVIGGVGGYYLMDSTGAIYAYDGSGSYAHTLANSANLVATLGESFYTTPRLLTNAPAPIPPAAMVNVSGDGLTVNVSAVSAGTVFEVIVTASDGANTTKSSFLVTVSM